MMNNCLSASDVALLSGSNNRDSNDNWENGGWIWILLILFLFWGGNGYGGWNNGNNGGGYVAAAATQADIARGFDNQAVIGKLDGITSGLCDGFYAMNNSMLTGFNGINTNVMQTGYGIQQAINADTVANMQNTNALQAQLQQCCCDNKSAIAQTQYQMATDTCAITTAIQQQTQDIMQNCNANYRALHDEMVQAQMDAKDAKIAEQASAIQALNLAQSQANQNTYLINALKPAPIPAFPAANLYGGLYGNSGCSGCNQTIGF
jgi:hypothetical protein